MIIHSSQLRTKYRRAGNWARVLVGAAMLALLPLPGFVYAQSDDNAATLKAQSDDLIKQGKALEAIPLLEKLIVLSPNDANAYLNLGFAYLSQGQITADPALRKTIRLKSRNSFIKAKELNVKEPVTDAMILSIPEDGSDNQETFSNDPVANALMVEAEKLFAGEKFDEALNDYQKALQMDPKLYYAALFSGDVFMHKMDYAKAEASYQQAITIDPNKETAYRYSATPLMKQQNYEDAKLRYVEAYVVEPYNKFAQAGLSQWAQVTHTQIGHPQIDIPVKVVTDEKGETKATMNLDVGILMNRGDGSTAWLAYGVSRQVWHDSKFAKMYPRETVYRHTLGEETEALQSVLSMAAKDKKVKKLSPALAKLKQLNDAGLLEAYILFAKPDDGIMKDFPDYLKQHRDLLRRYVLEFVLTAGGN